MNKKKFRDENMSCSDRAESKCYLHHKINVIKNLRNNLYSNFLLLLRIANRSTSEKAQTLLRPRQSSSRLDFFRIILFSSSSHALLPRAPSSLLLVHSHSIYDVSHTTRMLLHGLPCLPLPLIFFFLVAAGSMREKSSEH